MVLDKKDLASELKLTCDSLEEVRRTLEGILDFTAVEDSDADLETDINGEINSEGVVLLAIE